MPPSQERAHDPFIHSGSASQGRAGRATYISQACSVCRHKKIRCDGKRPVCSGCVASNRADECSWVKDAPPPRKTRNEAFFQALKKRNDALKEYANYLESLLERCQKEHGGLHDKTYLQRRPADVNMMVLDESTGTVIEPEAEEVADGDATEIQSLIAPVQKLTLERGSLMTFGSTSVMRFKPAVVPNPSLSVKPIDSTGTYVLLSSKSSVVSSEQSVEWDRYLPTRVTLTRVQHDTALDLVFKFVTSFCLRVVPGLFLRDMYRTLNVPKSSVPPKTAHYSPMLHNALLAVGLAMLDEPFRSLGFRQHFANEAKSYCDRECSQPNLSTVHAVSMLGTHFSSAGDQTLGFVYFGMASRISQALGLDVDCSEWINLGLIEQEEVQDRYGAFWTIFAQDVNWSLYVGRDFSVRAPTERDFKDMPVPYVDTEYDHIPFDHPASGIPPCPGYLSKTFASTCELLFIARRIMDVVNGISTTRLQGSRIQEMISDIDVQLIAWKDSLPQEVDLTPSSRLAATPHKLMLHTTYWWLFILLHRPYFNRKPTFIHSSKKEIDHVKLCKRATESIMELIKIWRDLYTLRNTTLNFFNPIFGAGTIFLLSGVQAATGVRVAKKELKHCFDSLELCIQYLGEMGKSWEMAGRVESMLRSLLEERLKPIVLKRKAAAGIQSKKAVLQEGESSQISSMASEEAFSALEQPAPHGALTGRSGQATPLIGVSSGPNALHQGPHPATTYTTIEPAANVNGVLSFPYASSNPLEGAVQTDDSPAPSTGITTADACNPSLRALPEDDMWTMPTHHFDPANFDTSRYFAMLGGQQLSDVPFVGPFALSGSFGVVDPLDQNGSLQDLDFMLLEHGHQVELDLGNPLQEDGTARFAIPVEDTYHLLSPQGFPIVSHPGEFADGSSTCDIHFGRF